MNDPQEIEIDLPEKALLEMSGAAIEHLGEIMRGELVGEVDRRGGCALCKEISDAIDTIYFDMFVEQYDIQPPDGEG